MLGNFFKLVFGGLSAVACGIIIADLGLHGYSLISSEIGGLNAASLSQAVSSVWADSGDGTAVSGLTRTVRYSASEEEDLINAASLSEISRSINGITASAYLVRNLDDGTTVAEKDGQKLLPIASLSKLVAAAVAERLIDPNRTVEISSQVISAYGNTAEFRVGEKVKALELYYPLLMVSSNDAAEALARAYGRGAFIQAMNDFVQSIGAYRTTFADPSGLSPDNRSTAEDIGLILDWIRRNDPEIISITLLKTKTIRNHTWENPAHFLSWSNYAGGKNGYTDEADRTAAALFRMGKDKKLYEVIILGSEVRDSDMVKLLAKIK